MDRIVENYLEVSECARSPDQLRDALSGVIASIDFPSFTYLALSKNAAPWLVSTYPPAWIAHYLERGYQERDPVVLRAWKYAELFGWSADTANAFGSAIARDFFCEARMFGIVSGITVPIHIGTDEIAAMTFASDRKLPQFSSDMSYNGLAFRFMALHFHANIRRMLEPTRLVDGASLTAREYEILEWACEGKSRRDIAQLTGFSHRIVVRDLERAKSKLQVRSTCQATALLGAYKARHPISRH